MKKTFVKLLSNQETPCLSVFGGKGHNLYKLYHNGFNVPKCYLITSHIYLEYLKQNNIYKRIKEKIINVNKNKIHSNIMEIKRLILQGKISDNIKADIEDILKTLNVEYVAVRSSAVNEDSLKSSFAGLHDSFLNVKAETNFVLDHVKKCWASLYNKRAILYRIRKNLPLFEGMGIIIQEMIAAKISGVTFTYHPVNKEALLIEAGYGIGDMIVSGKVIPDYYLVNRNTYKTIETKIGKKEKMSVVKDGKIKIISVPLVLTKKLALTNNDIREIAQTSIKVEKLMNYPQDIEWCIWNDKLWLLQSRAITDGFI